MDSADSFMDDDGSKFNILINRNTFFHVDDPRVDPFSDETLN